MAQNYGNDSIVQNYGASRIRQRPASMLGSSGIEGARHGFVELAGNALDEMSSGYGDKIVIKYHKDGSISIRDFGRGVPLGWNNKTGNWNWHTVYNDLYGGGKYNNNQWYLRSVDRWGEYRVPVAEDPDEYKMEFSTALSSVGVALEDIPTDGSVLVVGDMDVKLENNTVMFHVNNASWSTLTWEILNSRLNYLASVGLNGLGAASTQYTSEFFDVESYTKGKVTKMHFKRGIPVINGESVNMFENGIDLKKYAPTVEDTTEPDGTYIHWKPDSTVFSDVNIGADWLKANCQDIAYVAGTEVDFEDESTDSKITFKGDTLSAVISNQLNPNNLVLDDNDKPIFLECHNFGHGDTEVEGKPYTWVCKVDAVLGFVKSNSKTRCYHNSVYMHGGIQYNQSNAAISDFFKKKASLQGVKITDRDFEDIFSVVISSYSNYASFRGQTKDEVDNGFIGDLIYSAIYNMLILEYEKGNVYLNEAVNKVVQAARDRIAIKEYSEQIKQVNKTMKRQKDPEKFKSCREYMDKNYKRTELWIAEGDSAGGQITQARDGNFQAVLPIRGKCLNVLKSSMDKILANQEIQAIFSLLGTGMDIGGAEDTFDISKLRFDKIIFATDADEDGFQIRVLLFLIFYKLAPQLIKDGHVFIAETPRFQCTLMDGSVKYARDDAERDEIVKNNTVVKINRFKGLGEVNIDVLSKTTIAPETRNLVPVTLDFTDETLRDIIDAMFGMDKYKMRKQLFAEFLGDDVVRLMDDNALLLNELNDSDTDEGIDYQKIEL